MVGKTILTFSGSNRIGSVNLNILKMVSEILRSDGVVVDYFDLMRLPHFDANLAYNQYPDVVTDFLGMIERSDGIFITSPEYVFTMPSLLKNALEWTVSQNVFSFKPTAFIVAAADGQKTFVSLDLVLRTLVQEPIPPSRKLLIQGGRSKVSKHGEIQPEVLVEIHSLCDALLGAI